MTLIDYIYAKKGSQHELLLQLHNFISEYQGVVGVLKWGIPFYSINKPICYINPLKNNGVEVVFWSGTNLKESMKYLDQKKRKSMAGITYTHIDTVDFEILHGVLHEAKKIDAAKA